MHQKDIKPQLHAAQKSISDLIGVLSDIDINGPDQSTMVNSDGTETILQFTTEKRGDKTIGIYRLTLRNDSVNTVVIQEKEL